MFSSEGAVVSEGISDKPLQLGKYLRVLLLDDQVLFTDALARVLSEYGIDLITVSSRDELLATLCGDGLACDLVVLGMATTSGTPFKLLDDVRAAHQAIRVALLMANPSLDDLTDAVRLGAVGVIPHNSSLKTLVTAFRFMERGEQFLPASVLNRVNHAVIVEHHLTNDEQYILRELAIGRTNREISEKHGVGEGEVKSYIRSIFRKLGVNNRTHAAVIARKRGFL